MNFGAQNLVCTVSFLLKFYLVVTIFTLYYEKVFFSLLLEIGNVKGIKLEVQKNKKNIF